MESMYPHTCPECSAAAYIGGDQLVRCTNEDCRNMDPDLDIGKLELEFDWENDDTEPMLDLLDFSGIKIVWPV